MGPNNLAQVIKEQMSNAELLEMLQHMFSNMKAVPDALDEYHSKRPPPNVS